MWRAPAARERLPGRRPRCGRRGPIGHDGLRGGGRARGSGPRARVRKAAQVGARSSACCWGVGVAAVVVDGDVDVGGAQARVGVDVDAARARGCGAPAARSAPGGRCPRGCSAPAGPLVAVRERAAGRQRRASSRGGAGPSRSWRRGAGRCGRGARGRGWSGPGRRRIGASSARVRPRASGGGGWGGRQADAWRRAAGRRRAVPPAVGRAGATLRGRGSGGVHDQDGGGRGPR